MNVGALRRRWVQRRRFVLRQRGAFSNLDEVSTLVEDTAKKTVPFDGFIQPIQPYGNGLARGRLHGFARQRIRGRNRGFRGREPLARG